MSVLVRLLKFIFGINKPMLENADSKTTNTLIHTQAPYKYSSYILASVLTSTQYITDFVLTYRKLKVCMLLLVYTSPAKQQWRRGEGEIEFVL